MSGSRTGWVAVSIAVLGVLLAGCGSDLSAPPEYAWVFKVTASPVAAGDPSFPEKPCVAPGEAETVTYDYGLVVEGDSVVVYSNDAKLAEGNLRGTFISYDSVTVFTEYRTSAAGEPTEIEWLLEGHVSFVDQELSQSRNDTSDDALEIITLVSVHEDLADEFETGCQHVTSTVWEKR